MAETIERNTITAAIGKLESQLARLNESASALERIADRLDGPATQAGAVGTAAKDHPPYSVLDNLFQQLDALAVLCGRFANGTARVDSALGLNEVNRIVASTNGASDARGYTAAEQRRAY